jgi:Domain of unknown function (DUF4349)
MLRKRLFLALALLLVLVFMAACGATGVPAAGGRDYAAAPTAAPAFVEVEKEAVVEATQVVEVAVEAMPTVPAAAGDSGSSAQAIPRVQRMIIKNAELELLVKDTDVALDGVTVTASEYGGYIVSSHTWYEEGFKFATVRLGVPVIEFENVLRRLRGLALKVTSEVASGEDVTDQYVDLQSRLTNLKATQDRIREFLDKAQTVEEALKVNKQLSEVEAQIEEIQGQMNYMKDRAAFSTINVQLNPERPTPTPTPTSTPTPTPTPVAWRPGETFQDASDVLTSILKGLGNLLIWVLVVLGPFLVPLLLIIWLIVWLRRRKTRPAPPPRSPEPPPPES